MNEHFVFQSQVLSQPKNKSLITANIIVKYILCIIILSTRYISHTDYVLMCLYCVIKMRLKLTYRYTLLAGVIFHVVVRSATILN